MPLVAWPTISIPKKPLINGFSTESKEGAIHIEMSSSRTKSRQMVSSPIWNVTSVMYLTGEEKKIFRSFYSVTLGNGVNRFTMDLFIDDKEVNVPCKITSIPKFIPRGIHWSLSFEMEVEIPLDFQ